MKPIKIHQIPIIFKGNCYWLEPHLGLTLVGKKEFKERFSKITMPGKVKIGLNYTANPYLLKPLTNDFYGYSRNNKFTAWVIIFFLFILCRLSFLIVRKSNLLFKPCYQNANEAIGFFRKMTSRFNQDNLCLLRSFFAAYTSKRFSEGGVLIIGIFLPSKALHAWIIEDGQQPDSLDIEWINYQPIAVLY